MVLFFIIQFSGYWIQTDWSGGEGQYSWLDTSSYFASENMDGKVFPGQLMLSAPSNIWEGFSLPTPARQANVISESEPGILYIGCGWDSARVFKFGDFGNSLLARSNLGVGEVLSLQVLHNGDILVGTSTGRLWIGKDTQWIEVANFGTPIIKLYQPQDFNWIYLGTANGVIWVDENGSGLTWNYYEPLPNTQKVLDIFESSWGIFYAGTKSTDGKGRLFWSLYSGQHWDTLYTFPNSEAIYSIYEAMDGKLYVSTGYRGKIFTSSDSGQRWQELNSPSDAADFTHIICDPNNTLYISGKSSSKIPKGIVFISKDMGGTWDTLFCSSGWLPSRILSLAQSKLGLLFAGGDTNVVLRFGYCSSGWMESSVYDVFTGYPVVNGSLEFGRIHFTVNGDSVKVKVRSSMILDSMPEWGSYVPNDSNPVNYGSAHNGDRYIQYGVEAETFSQSFTPVMYEICLRYKMDVENPIISSAVAYDGDSIAPNIDIDDYVVVEFNEPTNTPLIETANIDTVLRLSSGHSWRSDAGRGVIKRPGEWITPSMLKIYLTTLRVGDGMGYPPTIVEADTVYPDSITICDKWGTACVSPCIITGKFGIEESEKLKVESVELRVCPNPFIDSTSIKYQIPVKSKVRLKIYDTAGRVVKILVDKENTAGTYTVKIEGIHSGIYFVRLDTGKTVIIQKLICFLTL